MNTKPPLHGLAAGTAPVNSDWTIPQHWERYSAHEHAIWKTLFDRQMQLLPTLACDEFLAGMEQLHLSADAIPAFDKLNQVLESATGWRVVAVPGLVPDEVFFTHLAERRFPASQFIRRGDQLDYIEEPDIFHDVLGHVPMLLNPIMADFIEAYGRGGLRAQSFGVLPLLTRVYWYSVEFGLVKQHDQLRIYGAGIVSSYLECQFALQSKSPNRIAFDLLRVMCTRYRIDDFQECYFVLDSMNDLLQLANIDFAPFYQAAQTRKVLAPNSIEASDTLHFRGNGFYHCSRNAI